MITAHDVAPHAGLSGVATYAIDAARPQLATKLLHVTLFATILTSPFALIEPSPHDALFLLLPLLAIAAGCVIDRRIVPLVLLLAVWNVGGIFAVTETVTQGKIVQYVATSIYLAVAAIIFASIVTQDSVRRMNIIAVAYIIAAFIISCIGIAAYFQKIPMADMFLLYGRVKSTFKDPNVFGPFLIFPLLVLIQTIFRRGPGILTTIAIGPILVALFLSFSRGAWFHFVLSAMTMVALMFLTAPTHRERIKIVGLTGAAAIAVVLLLLGLLSVSSLRTMLIERAQLVQSYDVGEGGRFRLQELAFGTLFDHPLGLGPLEFGRIFGLQQHNSYLHAFMVYGWIGGVTYLAMVAVTLLFGLRAALIRTPWQLYLIAAYGVFVGEAAESFIIDTDHWRHYFLILGLVWGLSAASLSEQAKRRNQPAVA